MGKHLDWYLVELERGLDKRMSAESAFELINQTEDHIHMIKQELMAFGMDEQSAEQAAIARFGNVNGLTGNSPAPKPLRANWASPALILIGSTVVVGASMVVGSLEAMMMAGALGLAGLALSAILCCRRGAFPGLAFGILLAVCFACLSVIADIQFAGPRFGFVARSERSKLLANLESDRVRMFQSDHLLAVGRKWVKDPSDPMPAELRTSEGYLVPSKTPWGSYLPAWTEHVGWRNGRLRTLFGWRSGTLGSLAMTYELTSLRHRIDAQHRWEDFEKFGMPERSIEYGHDTLDEAIQNLKDESAFRQDQDNLFVGVMFGVGLSTLWMLLAFVLNRLASLELSGGGLRPTVRPKIAD